MPIYFLLHQSTYDELLAIINNIFLNYGKNRQHSVTIEQTNQPLIQLTNLPAGRQER